MKHPVVVAAVATLFHFICSPDWVPPSLFFSLSNFSFSAKLSAFFAIRKGNLIFFGLFLTAWEKKYLLILRLWPIFFLPSLHPHLQKKNPLATFGGFFSVLNF